jgi:hypothetical protein
MYLEQQTFKHICRQLNLDPQDQSKNLERLKKSISVLHNQYLAETVKEVGYILEKNKQSQQPEIKDMFGLIMAVYNKRIKEHQTLFLLIHLFEIAIRTKLAVRLSHKYSRTNTDDWYLSQTPTSRFHAQLIRKVNDISTHKRIQLANIATSFDIFNLFSMGDIEWIIKTFWVDISDLFIQKTYKNQNISGIITKHSFLQKFSKIRHARNAIFHNNPLKNKRSDLIESIELILIHLGYNLFDAINNIDPEHKIIRFKYAY